jgi:CHAD domain-containing protein
VSTLIFTVNPKEKLEVIIQGLNKTEVMIGEWHDRIVLRDAIDLYLKNRKELQEDNLIPLKKLRQSLIDDNQTLLQDLLPEVNNVVLLIMHSPETDKTGGEEVRK